MNARDDMNRASRGGSDARDDMSRTAGNAPGARDDMDRATSAASGARDDLNRATREASQARDDLDRAGDDLKQAAGHTGEAARHAKEALKAGASGTVERAGEVAGRAARKTGRMAEQAADTALHKGQQAGHAAGHVAQRMGEAQPDRELEHRADAATENVLDRAGQGLKGAAPTVGKGVETATRLTGSALHAAAGPLAAVAGKIAGKVGGWWESARQKTAEFNKDEEKLCLRHFETYETRPADLTFDYARTAYQIGYLAAENPAYQGRSFDDIEAEVRHGFDESETEQYRTLRDFTRFGYERAMIIRPPQDGDRVTLH
jgi:hypothetical protein